MRYPDPPLRDDAAILNLSRWLHCAAVSSEHCRQSELTSPFTQQQSAGQAAAASPARRLHLSVTSHAGKGSFTLRKRWSQSLIQLLVLAPVSFEVRGPRSSCVRFLLLPLSGHAKQKSRLQMQTDTSVHLCTTSTSTFGLRPNMCTCARCGSCSSFTLQAPAVSVTHTKSSRILFELFISVLTSKLGSFGATKQAMVTVRGSLQLFQLSQKSRARSVLGPPVSAPSEREPL